MTGASPDATDDSPSDAGATSPRTPVTLPDRSTPGGHTATTTCRHCRKPLRYDELWGWIHITGHYVCDGPHGWPGTTEATPE